MKSRLQMSNPNLNVAVKSLQSLRAWRAFSGAPWSWPEETDSKEAEQSLKIM